MWPVLLVGVVGYLLWNNANQLVNHLQYSPKKLNFGSLSLFSTTLNYSFEIKNPTNSAATVDYSNGFLYAGATELGTYEIKNPIVIQPRSSTVVNTEVRVNNGNALRSIWELWRSSQLPKITIKGYMQTALARIPFDYTVAVATDFNLKKPA